MPDSTILVCLFVLASLLPGGALLAGGRMPPGARSGLMLACGGTMLAVMSVVAAAAVAFS